MLLFADSAQPLTTTGDKLDDLDHDLCADDLSLDELFISVDDISDLSKVCRSCRATMAQKKNLDTSGTSIGVFSLYS